MTPTNSTLKLAPDARKRVPTEHLLMLVSRA
jgi:hypothetical protein